ncbi:hypothetical protein [uncultured Helicobacter sp.]|uniref:hypothetical protein n=1 Tax=uncultured Helicobacter sp. TaxID=175537 RepID=UPI00374F808A
MKYKVLYDTLINKVHTPKGTEIEFQAGTDEGYIKRLLANKVITPLDSSADSKTESKPKDSKKKKQNEVKQEDIQAQESEAEQES